ncbi:hypothetical protein C8J34_1023 [Rhizobium sp. PP-F2F-G36]|nr:hypothetical protein C8J34_1023 [Rhizobium sp. PP-F2F-G36]
MPSLEETCLDRYFLGPGSLGPVGSVYVSDEDLLDIFGVESIADAQRAFLRGLPHITLLRDKLSGEMKPAAGRTPDYVRILVFLCWMQTTKTRQRGDRDFREMLEKQTGERFKGSLMRGLNPMWEHLRNHLLKVHGIELDLPGIKPHSQIGRTLRLAFPTWRDRAVLRRLRHVIGSDRLLDPLAVYNRVATSRHLLTEKMPSFEYNFDLFNSARKLGGREYMDTPFWQAWYAIVAEMAALEELEIVEGEFGEYEIFRTSPLGTRAAIRTPEEAVKFVPQPIARSIGRGNVLMESMGFGRYRSSSDPNTNMLLLTSSRLKECPEGIIRSCITVNPRWALVTFNSRESSKPERTAQQTNLGWMDGIRVGSGLLGRTPFTPCVVTHKPHETSVKVGGSRLGMIDCAQNLSFPDGVYSGTASATLDGKTREVMLVAHANEVGEARRLPFDPARDMSEDEFLHDTVPSLQSVGRPWKSGRREETCNEMITMAEALYSRIARGLSFSYAFEMVRRGLSRADSRPGDWDIIRTFSDAGWFDLTLLRNHPARRMLLRSLTWQETAPGRILLRGPAPMTVVDRLRTAAAADGVMIESYPAASRWSLPRYVLVSGDPARLRRFAIDVGLQPHFAGRQPETLHSDGNGVHGYEVISRLDEPRGYFDTYGIAGLNDGLFKLERKETHNPFLYRSVIDGLPAENFVSPTLAILCHHLRRKRTAFSYDGLSLAGQFPRIALPSSWARWMSDMVLCNAGPVYEQGLWRYSYPADEAVVAALGKYVTISRPGASSTPWIDRFLASESRRQRRIFDIGTGMVRSARSAQET